MSFVVSRINMVIIFMEMNTTERYSERIRYDKNSNVSDVARYGMNNLRGYGVIDSLEITRSGNQLVAIEDHAEKNLTYTGASDFVDGTDLTQEYAYDGNGRLTMDTNRGIASIAYDLCNNPQAIAFTGANGIDYVYASDGTRLRTVHVLSGIGGSVTRDTTDYLGNLVMRDGHLGMYRFDGGYVSFNNDTIDGWHYYIQDYMGNNRLVVRDSIIEQITHYYPYGGVIGDISTNENLQKYKFEGKELDRTFGLDNYDIHARQYFAMAPMWDRIDPLAEKYYGISPYSYCGGDPVNLGDYNGRDTINITFTDGKWQCSDPIMAKGDDVFVINYEGRILKHVFSAGEYGKRVCILYLDSDYNPDEKGSITLSAYHVSGAEEGCTGFLASPAGETSLEYGSNKSMPTREYALKFYGEPYMWQQPGIDWGGSNLQGADRGIRFHYGNGVIWTHGCYVFLTQNAEWNYNISKSASESFDTQLGATGFYQYTKVINGKRKTRTGAYFTNANIKYKAYVNRLDYSFPNCTISTWFQ